MNRVATVLKNRVLSGNLIAVLLALILPMLIQIPWSLSDGLQTTHIFEEKSSLLPALTENFMGRKEDMEKITKLLRFAVKLRIVTLLGLPGVGKSTTAIHLAHQESRKGTLVMYVNLSDRGNVNGIKMKIVEEAFDQKLTVEELDIKFNKWIKHRRKPLLLVLDNYDEFPNFHSHGDLNFSHFLRDELDINLMKATVVVTSREKIPLAASLDVRNHTLAPLSDESSVDLFVNNPILTTVPPREKLRLLVSLIGGVPLALDIAAQLIKNEGIDSVVSKLNESLTKHLSTEDNFGVSNESVSISIGLSYDYLTDKQKMCGQFLSCFPSSFTAHAATAIVSSLTDQSESSIEECLDVLKQRFLLQQTSNEANMYNFHKLLKDFFNDKLNSTEKKLSFESRYCHYYTKTLQDFGLKYLKEDVSSLAEIDRDRHNLLYMFHLLEGLNEKSGASDKVLNTSVHAIIDLMSLKHGSIIAHMFSSLEIHQSLTKIVEYVHHQYAQTFDGSMSPLEFARYGTTFHFWAVRYRYAKGKLPENGVLSVRSVEKKVHDYLSGINAEDCSFPTVVIPCIRILEITCYDKHHHTALSLCSQGNETLALLQDKLAQHDHTKCPNANKELGLAHYELGNTQNATYFLEILKRSHSQDPINSTTDSHLIVTLCDAYSDSGEADKCDKLCESTIQDVTGIPVSGKNFRLFGLVFMYYWKHDKVEKSKEARRITEELLHYFGDRFAPKNRGFLLDIRCLLTSIAHYYHHVKNYSIAIDVYNIVIKSSFAESVYHRERPLVAATNDLLSAFCLFRMGMAMLADRQLLNGLDNIHNAVTKTLHIAENKTLHDHLNRTTHPEDAMIVTVGSKHLATIVCEEGFLHPYCLWQVLRGALLIDGGEQSHTQHLYNHICGYYDSYGASFDPWRLN